MNLGCDLLQPPDLLRGPKPGAFPPHISKCSTRSEETLLGFQHLKAYRTSDPGPVRGPGGSESTWRQISMPAIGWELWRAEAQAALAGQAKPRRGQGGVLREG